ncbi:hypothetical protein MOB18_20255 [Bacillus inaquosorum]|uniref:hypothetical protein n=1 Tax=Bacillus inaquosorum TaxID=483913 RepID=UPI0022811C72|nr:hypothetical protein [Bacillus inaquosorum]MCY7751397.1 hypothetical protein [Bacillus inaquosorum]
MKNLENDRHSVQNEYELALFKKSLRTLIMLILIVMFFAFCFKILGTALNESETHYDDIEQKKYELLAEELNVKKKNIVISHKWFQDFDIATTDRGEYKVVFKNDDDIEKIVILNISKE